MKLATLKNNGLDGRLVVVSHDHSLAAPADDIASSLLDALQRWDQVAPLLHGLRERLNRGAVMQAFAFDPQQCAAPLPRCPQWLDGSAFLNHGRLMERAFNTPPIPDFETVPVMYQGASDDFLGPHDDMPLPAEADGIDFEGEFGVVCGPVPMAVSPAAALHCVRLIVQLNDWSLRALGPHEMKTGFGFLQAKPSTAFAPVAVTPDELGGAWRDGRVHMRLHVQWNGERFGAP
ncbi:MAG TPA: fumarylacetoacetate hydrolase family protein, partial [Burkholderiaceae bacterium]|nr:fumarylacetoacetate hydrolase family protein [Burkholderiaceae bacterium]